ncbi:MAG: hypothetical protein ACFB0B_19370 [Thermonemataceae bacterium]
MDNSLKAEIDQILAKLPESHLAWVLTYLRQVEEASEEQLATAHYLKKIMEEDAELLKKLAQ